MVGEFWECSACPILLDACFSGLAAAERKVGFDPKNQTIQRLMQPASHIVTAGIEGEESFIFNEKSLFTAAFLAAARGSLASPNDGVISLSEMMVQIKSRNRIILSRWSHMPLHAEAVHQGHSNLCLLADYRCAHHRMAPTAIRYLVRNGVINLFPAPLLSFHYFEMPLQSYLRMTYSSRRRPFR
jgi:hypothetical protein